MMRTSHSFLEPSWRKTTKMTLLEGKTSPHRKKESIPFPPKKIRQQVTSSLAGHQTKLPTTLKKLKTMVASPATAAGVTTAATAVAMIVVLELPRRPSAARPLACTGGRL
jgi:hypothetical protein